MSPLYVMIKKSLSSNPPTQNPGPPPHLQHLQNSPPHPPPPAHIDPRYASAHQNPQPLSYGLPQPHPNMVYSPPPAAPSLQAQPAPWILLGFQPSLSGAQHAVYGPPGAQFDHAGNIFIPHEGGSKEYITPYRGYNGKVRDPPTPEEDCCGFWHWIGVRTDYHWMSTRDWGQGVGVRR